MNYNELSIEDIRKIQEEQLKPKDKVRVVSNQPVYGEMNGRTVLSFSNAVGEVIKYTSKDHVLVAFDHDKLFSYLCGPIQGALAVAEFPISLLQKIDIDKIKEKLTELLKGKCYGDLFKEVNQRVTAFKYSQEFYHNTTLEENDYSNKEDYLEDAYKFLDQAIDPEFIMYCADKINKDAILYCNDLLEENNCIVAI